MSRSTGHLLARTLSVGLLAAAVGGAVVCLTPPPPPPPPPPRRVQVPPQPAYSREEVEARVAGMDVPEVVAKLGTPSEEARVDPGGEWRLSYRWLTDDGTPDRSDPVTVIVLAGGRVTAGGVPRRPRGGAAVSDTPPVPLPVS